MAWRTTSGAAGVARLGQGPILRDEGEAWACRRYNVAEHVWDEAATAVAKARLKEVCKTDEARKCLGSVSEVSRRCSSSPSSTRSGTRSTFAGSTTMVRLWRDRAPASASHSCSASPGGAAPQARRSRAEGRSPSATTRSTPSRGTSCEQRLFTPLAVNRSTPSRGASSTRPGSTRC